MTMSLLCYFEDASGYLDERFNQGAVLLLTCLALKEITTSHVPKTSYINYMVSVDLLKFFCHHDTPFRKQLLKLSIYKPNASPRRQCIWFVDRKQFGIFSPRKTTRCTDYRKICQISRWSGHIGILDRETLNIPNFAKLFPPEANSLFTSFFLVSTCLKYK